MQTFYTPQSQTKKFHNLDESSSLKWLIFGIKIAKLISMHVIRLTIRANKFANRTLLPAIFNFKVFIDWTRVYDEVNVSVVHTNSPNPSDPKKSNLESDFKNMRFQKQSDLYERCLSNLAAKKITVNCFTHLARSILSMLIYI